MLIREFEITAGGYHEKTERIKQMARKVIPPEQRQREGAILKLLWDRYLKDKNRTQSSVIEELGINPGQPSNWFKGIKPIPSRQLIAQGQLMGWDPLLVRPQLAEELDLWLSANQPAIELALERRYQGLDSEGRKLVETALELAEARQRSK